MHSNETYEPRALPELETLIGYTFKDPALLSLAVTHPSTSIETHHPDVNYQRLEFLGDSVLSLILVHHLYARYPKDREGMLTSMVSALTKGTFLVKIAKHLQLQNFVRLSKAEVQNKGFLRPSILEDALEAIVGAIFLDSNFEIAQSIVLKWYDALQVDPRELVLALNPKGQLQEYLIKTDPKTEIAYPLIEEWGPDHCKSFTVAIAINRIKVAVATARSKKAATEGVAREALRILGTEKILTAEPPIQQDSNQPIT